MPEVLIVVYLLIGAIVAGAAYGILPEEKKNDVMAFNLFMTAVLWPFMLVLAIGSVFGKWLRDA